jgi:type IX secretion system PorP/SprF family membrane protein
MKKVATILILLLTGCMDPTRAWSQDPVFSQFYSSGLYLNPALAGVERENFLGANYRSQWSNLSMPFNTFQASFIHPVYNRGIRKKHLGGFGTSILNDVAGPNKEFATQAFSLAVAWNVRINHNDRHTISFALQGGVSQQRVSYESLHWSSQYSAATGFDPALAGEGLTPNLRMFRPIMNTGMIWSYNSRKTFSKRPGVSYFNGLALNNLVKAPTYFPGNANNHSLLFKSHGGMTIPLSHKLDLSPNYLFMVQGAARQLNIGAYAGYSLPADRHSSPVKVIAGIWHRLYDGMIFSAGVATKNINVGFSYDNNFASMGKTFGYAGAYEFSISYRAPGRDNFKRISSPLI